jgi:hypothetical protein
MRRIKETGERLSVFSFDIPEELINVGLISVKFKADYTGNLIKFEFYSIFATDNLWPEARIRILSQIQAERASRRVETGGEQ